jgi:hypothetical protein
VSDTPGDELARLRQELDDLRTRVAAIVADLEDTDPERESPVAGPLDTVVYPSMALAGVVARQGHRIRRLETEMRGLGLVCEELLDRLSRHIVDHDGPGGTAA